MTEGPYNPLARTNIGRSVEYALLTRDPVPLGELPRFNGAGIYALYYTGPEPLYRPISDQACRIPIYVGKADVPGGRKGLVTGTYRGTPLWGRLREHAESISAAENLDLADFQCRFLVVDDIWIPLGESLMIGNYRPVWNVIIDGFGLHDPGSRRHGGLRSEWDELHPGRSWRNLMLPRTDTDTIVARIQQHFADTRPPSTSEIPDDGEADQP